MKTLASAIALAAVAFAPVAFANGHDKAKEGSKASYGEKKAAKNIIETAKGAGSFTTLVAAVEAAGLVPTLEAAGPYTVFAPTDDAFKKLPAGTVENLLKPENVEQLRAILLLHVVGASVESSTVAGKAASVASAQGQQLNIDGTDGVTVNGAKVVTADIKTSNGIIHAIDTVLLPAAPAAGE